MAAARAMTVFQGASLLPEDRFVNTFHFDTSAPEDFDVLKLEIVTLMADFWATQHNGSALRDFISPYVVSIAIQVYDMELPPHAREPHVDTLSVSGTAQSVPGLPEEVSVCVTLEGAAPVTPRRRGRFYLGPLNSSTNVLVPGSTTDPARPNITGAQSVGFVAAAACTQLATQVDVPWCIRSTRPAENYVRIVGGYVDNAFDTQRRRGPDSSDRLVWGPV